MNSVNDKKIKRMIINNAKTTLKNNAEALKQNYNLDVPKDILNMDNGEFYIFVTEVAYPIMKGVETTRPEILDVIAKLQACVRAFADYHREFKAKTL